MQRTTLSKEHILELLRIHRNTLHALGVSQVGLFGSFVRGEQNDQSDVDLLVAFEPGKKSFDNFVQLAYWLEDLLGRRVELVTPESLSPYLGPSILKEVEYVA
ncbi:MAG: nucleotidyltransferase family protein [Anaerolineae bacterium]|nr:nucleotidyltransferase family protein [Anaerolineae bacterium]